MINNFVNLKLALKIYISNALKWKEEDVLVVEEEEKVGVLPYVYKNRIYFGQKPQTGKGVVSKFLANLLKNAGDIIDI